MEIRAAFPEDLGELERVERSCFFRDRYPRRMLRSLLTEEEFRTFLACDQGAVVGAISIVLLPPGQARLVSIATMPEHRNQGIARRMLQKAEEVALAEGSGLMTLEVGTANLAALNLYLKEGFKIIGIIPDYYGRSRDAFYMEKRLSDRS